MKKHVLTIGCALMFGACNIGDSGAQSFKTKHYKVKIVTVAKGLYRPWGLDWLPDGRILVTEKSGSLRLVSQTGDVSEPIKGLPSTIDDGGQGGLLDVAVDPDFKENQTIYLSYSERGSGGLGTAAVRAALSDNQLTDVKIIFRQEPKSSGGRHFGSRFVFDRNGALFITTGDRGQRNRVQNFEINRGQVIRVNKDGSIPDDNPFVGRKGYRAEVWSLGHRNIQGATLHPDTGQLWTVEHGARGGDELNKPQPGLNYGWPIISYGRHYSGGKIGVGNKKQGLEQPVHYWDPSIAPSGLTFYSGDKFPKWKDNLFVGALSYQLVARLELDGDKVVNEERILQGLGERVRDVRQGPDGYLYVLTDASNGRILRLEPDGR